MDEGQLLFRAEAHGLVAGLVVVGAVQDDLGAVAACCRHLDQRRGERHDDERSNSALGRVIGDALRVVAGAGCDDAARCLLRRELRMLLSAPRSLKEPVICRFSSLK